jgi:hypothetical protein
MDKAQLVDGLDRQDTLGHVKLGDVFRKRIVLDQPAKSHPVSESNHCEFPATTR